MPKFASYETSVKNDNMIKNNLCVLLGERKMKISELAKIIQIDYSAVSRFYHEKTTLVSLELIDKICWALEVTPGELFTYIPDDSPEFQNSKKPSFYPHFYGNSSRKGL